MEKVKEVDIYLTLPELKWRVIADYLKEAEALRADRVNFHFGEKEGTNIRFSIKL